MRIRPWPGCLLLTALAALAGPAAGAASGAAPAKVRVVAAEDTWGSIARQLAGDHADVTSIISDPDTDPHDYEPTPRDGAAMATAQVAIVNGIGYDGWAHNLLAANPSSRRRVVTVGDVVGIGKGGNPHQWYSPKSVMAVIDAVTEALQQADPADAAYFDARRQAYEAEGLKRYDDLRAQIRAHFGGTAVGASESIFAPLAEDLGLRLLTPRSFLDAVSEGSEPAARDKSAVDRQITNRQIRVFVDNPQNSTPDVAVLVGKAKAAGIPVATFTETLTPEGASFQEWQADQLQRLAGALAAANGRGTAASAAPAPAPPPAPAPAGPPAPSRTPAHWLVFMAVAALVVGAFGLLARAGAGSEAHDLC